MSPTILTHRGLESSKPDFYPESSIEAFENQLKRGFGIEFDPNFTPNEILVWHDATFERAKGKIPTLDEVMELIRNSTSLINALHFKGKFQNPRDIKLLIKYLKRNSDVLFKILVFDVKPQTANMLLRTFPDLQLAPSVAHQYDVTRFNSVVANTLIETDEAVELLKKGVFGKNPWCWLDEWDLEDEGGGVKKLYTFDVFGKMRKAGAKIALVTSELHGTSPGLYGGESHPDSKDLPTLFKRIKEILSLKPDAICTDYPEEVLTLISSLVGSRPP